MKLDIKPFTSVTTILCIAFTASGTNISAAVNNPIPTAALILNLLNPLKAIAAATIIPLIAIVFWKVICGISANLSNALTIKFIAAATEIIVNAPLLN